jgi:hypothetical protein
VETNPDANAIELASDLHELAPEILPYLTRDDDRTFATSSGGPTLSSDRGRVY